MERILLPFYTRKWERIHEGLFWIFLRTSRKHFRWWHSIRSRLRPMIEKVRMIKRFDNIVTYLNHRITNAARKSINSQIQWVKYTARGFRSKSNFITAIYLDCGGVDLMPLPTKMPKYQKS